MQQVINDHIFWIYLVVILFFTIIGVYLILSQTLTRAVPILIIWLLINVSLLVMVYSAININWGRSPIRTCINVLFTILLILSLIFIDRLNESDISIVSLAGVLTLLAGLVMIKMISVDCVSMVAGVVYLILWLGLILYTLVHNQEDN